MRTSDLRREIDALPVIDVHSHLRWHKAGADSLHDVVLYHMMRYLYRAADSPDGSLFTLGNDANASLDAAAATFPAVRSTGFGRMLGMILRELYGFEEELTPDSLPRLQAVFGKAAANPEFGGDALRKAGAVRVLTSRIRDVPPPDASAEEKGFRFTIETSLTSGIEEFLTIRERLRALKDRVRSMTDLQEATDQCLGRFDWKGRGALVAWMGARADFTPVDNVVVDGIISDALNGVPDTPRAAALFQGAVVRCMCDFVKRNARVFQLVYGTQMQRRGTGNFVSAAGSDFAATLGFLAAEFPEVHFNILNGYEPDEMTLCSLCVGYPNVSLAGHWWHAFYPSVMHASWHRRLEMVPATRLCGFFSDGWCAEWTWARLTVVRETLARVLEEKVASGFYSRGQAIDVARRILGETPRRIFLPTETDA